MFLHGVLIAIRLLFFVQRENERFAGAILRQRHLSNHSKSAVKKYHKSLSKVLSRYGESRFEQLATASSISKEGQGKKEKTKKYKKTNKEEQRGEDEEGDDNFRNCYYNIFVNKI